jgi:hypothetical protein
LARPPGWPLGDGKVRQAVEAIDRYGRLKLPDDFRTDIPTDLLALHLDAGRVRLLPWEPTGARADADYLQLAEGYVTSEVLEQMVSLSDRHQRLTMMSDGRVIIPKPVQFHLGLDLGSRQHPTPRHARELLVWRFPEWLELWTRGYRRRRHRTEDAES